MSESVDYYDVQAMIRDARSEIRGEISDAMAAVRAAVREELDGLHEELRALARVLASRTDHLA